MRARLTYANVMSSLAVFIALGGGAYAAATLPRNGVGPKQLKRDAVKSGKVKDRSLLARDFKTGELPAGPAGPAGPKGDTGPQGSKGDTGAPGTARAFAHILVAPGGATVDATRSEGIGQASVARAGVGVVCFKNLGFTPRHMAANGDAAETTAVVVSVALAPDALVLGACGGDAQAALAMQTVEDPVENADHGVYVSFN